ncbi:Tat pathway signal protein [Sphingomonas sp. Leaf33]|uniref:DUF885 domain-containing protein n=1 Tax=Sphingomonas sp. Leaf33 TaxID=1736215 RepID=UPI0006F26C63|nr:DUF885 family protein [Sphingomonas sp. Leaf33]KQN25124.1 Tat pathway signal protein [Sphingomonas sp. Leaf33]
MDRRNFLASTAAAGAIGLVPAKALAAQAKPAAGARDAALDAQFNRIFMEAGMRSPELATSLGFDKGPGAPLKRRLADRSPAARAENLARTKAAIATIEGFDPATLSKGAQLNRDVVLYQLRSQIVGPEQFGVDSPQRPFVITQQGGAYFSVPDFLNSSHTITTADDAEGYLDRTRAFATALDQDSANQAAQAARGYLAPGFSLDLALGQMATLRRPAPADSTLTQSIVRRTAGKIPGDWGARCATIVANEVYPALDRQIALVTKLRKTARTSAGLWDVPQGAALYAAALEQATTTKFTPDEVHKLGLQQVAEISAQLDTILKGQGLTRGTVGERLTALNARPDQVYADTPAGRKELIDGLNAGNAAMQAKLARAFITPPNAPLMIQAVPTEIQDGASNGYYSRAALDGSRPAIYWINLKSVADWPKYTLPSLTYHEGVPGHHLQITIAQGSDQPLIRKVGGFSAYSEGWALYAEQVADELGGYATPLEKAGYLQSFLFRAARLVIDTGIHAKRWTREQATDYMVATTGFARPRSQREVERYCTQAGQACSYKVGHIAWLRARDNAKKILGAKYDVKTFHEVLRDGAVPLTILERLVEERARALV